MELRKRRLRTTSEGERHKSQCTDLFLVADRPLTFAFQSVVTDEV